MSTSAATAGADGGEPPVSTQDPEAFGIGRLFWVMSDAVVGADLETSTIVLWNPAAETLFGYSAAEALGMPLARLVPDELVGSHLAGIERYRRDLDPVLVGGGPTEVPAVTRDGDRRVVALTLSDVSVDGSRTHMVAVMRDMTDIRHAEQHLHDRNATLREFIATASHDLRNPLASVLGYARLLEERADALGPDKVRQHLGAIAHSAARAARLVDDMLMLSQIQAGVMNVRPEPVDLAELITAAVRMAEVDAEVAVTGRTRVTLDPHHLERILVNFLTNAVKYGAPPLRVESEVHRYFCEVVVVDHGPGIPDEFVPRLFDSFARADPRRTDGTGLGLSIVRGLADAHDGQAFYRRGADGTSRFGVRLPVG